METIILAISLLFAILYLFFLLVDILKTAFFKLKGTDCKWQTSGLFIECKSWVNVLILGILLFLGFYAIGTEYARVKTNEVTGTMTYCDECKRKLPSKYTLEFYGDYVCPSCFQSFYNEEIAWYTDALENNDDLLIDGRSIRDVADQVYAEYGMTPYEALSVIDEYEYDYTHGGYTWAEYKQAIEVVYYTASIFPYDY